MSSSPRPEHRRQLERRRSWITSESNAAMNWAVAVVRRELRAWLRTSDQRRTVEDSVGKLLSGKVDTANHLRPRLMYLPARQNLHIIRIWIVET